VRGLQQREQGLSVRAENSSPAVPRQNRNGPPSNSRGISPRESPPRCLGTGRTWQTGAPGFAVGGGESTGPRARCRRLQARRCARQARGRKEWSTMLGASSNCPFPFSPRRIARGVLPVQFQEQRTTLPPRPGGR
jgi:hypothetical protein